MNRFLKIISYVIVTTTIFISCNNEQKNNEASLPDPLISHIDSSLSPKPHNQSVLVRHGTPQYPLPTTPTPYPSTAPLSSLGIGQIHPYPIQTLLPSSSLSETEKEKEKEIKNIPPKEIVRRSAD